MASELRDMDNEVSALSRALAVRTLQLEMEFIYGCLEDEAMDITQGISAAAFMLFRYGGPRAIYGSCIWFLQMERRAQSTAILVPRMGSRIPSRASLQKPSGSSVPQPRYTPSFYSPWQMQMLQ